MVQDAIKKIARLGSGQLGQDLIEYALLAGLVATSATAISPAIAATADRLSTVISVLANALSATATQ